jgi:two-component system phosphate regulon response regulator PhoB
MFPPGRHAGLKFPAEAADSTSVSLHVLVVDDDELSRTLVARVLESHGLAVETVTSGVEALIALERRRPDVIVLDIMMPGMSGAEVLDRVKSSPRFSAIPVIMLTARADDEDLIASYQSGADYFVSKPLVPSQLLYGIGLVTGRAIAGAAAPARPASRPARPRS